MEEVLDSLRLQIVCDAQNLKRMKDLFKGLTVQEAKIVLAPNSRAECFLVGPDALEFELPEEKQDVFGAFLEELEENDDVDEVFHDAK